MKLFNQFRVVTIVAVFGLQACGDDEPAKPSRKPPLAIALDETLAPSQATLPSDGGAPRTLARMVGDSGIAMDFVTNELVVGAKDEAALAPLLERWGGTIVSSTQAIGEQLPLYLIRLDPSAAQVDAILVGLNKDVPDLTGTFKTGNALASQLLAVALSEANTEGLTVTPNIVMTLSSIAEGSTLEAPSGDSGFASDAFNWPYMNRGSAQDIGVGAAWQALQRAGKLGNHVRMMILDGGFAPSNDFPANRSVVGFWNTSNLLACSGGAGCPWHGTMVTTAAMGVPDNSFGAAGPAGPVADLIAVPFQSDFFGLISTLDRIVNATVFGNPKIINMSFGFELDLGWDIAAKVACLGLCPSPSEALGAITATVAGTGKLLFAAAGNDGKDVDNAGDVIEGSTQIPCELPGVICVGGMAHDQTARDPGSNFGSKTGDATVDIYGPYSVWVGPDPDNTANATRLVNGTSFASPFVAGVAALVWAADPTLSASDVWGIVRDTAHVGGVGVTGNDRRVDAFAAVASVLGGAAPTVVLNASATVPLNREVSVVAQVTDDGTTCPPVSCPLTWDPAPARTVGNVAYYRFDTVGEKVIQVTALDSVGQDTTGSTSVTVENSAPAVSISAPLASAEIPQGLSAQLLGSATDLNEGDDPGPGAIECHWTSSNSGDASFPRNGCNTSATFASTGARTLTLSATDPEGLTSMTTVSVTVTPPPSNLPPNITLGTLTPGVNYNDDGYDWATTLAATGSATDPEGNTPISYTWKATSLYPNSSEVYASNVTVEAPNASGNLSWQPSSTPALLGDFGALGNNCYYGQVVRLTLEATDSQGNTNTKTLPDIKVYRCILI